MSLIKLTFWQTYKLWRTRNNAPARREFYAQFEPHSEGQVLEFNRAAKFLFYPVKWDAAQAHRDPIVQHMTECEGVDEASIRDMRYLDNKDVIEVRTRNWRKFTCDGQHLWEHERSTNKKGN